MNRNHVLEAWQRKSAQSVRALPPDPADVQRRLQQAAQTHPDIAPLLEDASRLIGSETAALIDIIRTIISSRLPEHFG